jgi:hypothetical protein
MSESIEYVMKRKIKGTRTFFYPVINNKRLNSTNYARKYNAKNLVVFLLKKYGAEQLYKIVNKEA